MDAGCKPVDRMIGKSYAFLEFVEIDNGQSRPEDFLDHCGIVFADAAARWSADRRSRFRRATCGHDDALRLLENRS
jgi:hypothetical protein